MRERLQQAQLRVLSLKFAKAIRGIELIIVAGDYGKTTTSTFLSGILTEAGKNVATLLPHPRGSQKEFILSFFNELSALKKQGKTHVIVEATAELLRSGALGACQVESLVIMNDAEDLDTMLAIKPKHLILPSTLELPESGVQPYQQITFGDDNTADARIDTIKLMKGGTELSLTIDHQTRLELATYLGGQANAYCLVAAVAAAYVSGVELSAMQEGIIDIESLGGHFETEKGPVYTTILDQAVRPESIERAVSSARQLTTRRLVVGFDTAPSDDVLKAIDSSIDRIFLNDTSEGRNLPVSVEAVESIDDVIEKSLRSAKTNDIVLLLGKTFNLDDIMSRARENGTGK